MQVIVKDSFHTLRRRKYVPKKVNPEWVIYDTNLKQRIYGPATHAACMRELER